MAHMLTVFLYELKRNFRRPGFLFTTFGVPVLLFLATNVIGDLAAQNTSINSTDPEAIQEFTEQFDPTMSPNVGLVDLSGVFGEVTVPDTWQRFDTDEEARAAIAAEVIDLYYLIEADYLETGNVITVVPEFQMNAMGDSTLSSIARQYFSQGVDPDIAARIVYPAIYSEENLTLTATVDGKVNEDATFLIVYAFALTLMVTLFMTNGYLMQTLIEEKETRLVEILVSMVRPLHLLAGKILALGVLGLLQIVVWIGGMILLVNIAGGQQAQNIGEAVGALGLLANLQLPLDILPILLVYFLLSYLMFAGFYSVISAISNSMREGPQYAVVFMLPALAPFYFLSLFATTPDAPLVVFLSLFPLTAPISMTARLVVSEVPFWQIALSIGLLALTVVFAIWLAARVFRAGVLLAGNVPKLKDIPAIIRG